MHFQPDLLPDEPMGDRFLTADGHHDSTIRASVWPILLSSSPYLDTSKGTGLQGTGLLDCWP